MTSNKLLKVDRQLSILAFLRTRTAGVRISDLSTALQVSVITVRRDVAELSRQGMVVSTRGGVKLLREGTTYEPRYETKLGEDPEMKDRLAQYTADLLEDGTTVFLDGGTTVGALGHYLFRRNLTVVTNALNVANVLAGSKTVRLIFVGGTFRHTSQTFLGPKAVRALQELRFDVACMGTEGFDPDRGAEVPDESDAEFKSAAIHLATQVWLLSTASKCGKRRLYRFAHWADVHRLILCGPLDEDATKLITNHGVEVITVPQENERSQPKTAAEVEHRPL